LVAVVALVGSGCGWITRVDVRDDGKSPTQGAVQSVATNFDGTRTAMITSSQLVADDTDQTDDIYLVTNPGSNVELESGDLPADAAPDQIAITSGGDALAFVSPAKLTADDTDNRRDVYWLDPDNGTIVRASVDDGALFDDITSFDAPKFVSDGDELAFFGDDTANHRHLFVRDLQAETTREIPIAAGEDVVQIDSSAQRLVELDADQTISVFNVVTDQDLGPDCVGSSPTLGAGSTLVAVFAGGTGCPTGAARYDTVTKTFTPFSVPADAQFVGLDDSEGVLLWRLNDGSQHWFTTSFVTGRTQLVSDAGGTSSAVPALDVALSGDGSAVVEVMPPFPADVGNTRPRAYLHTTMPPIASNVTPSSVARGQTTMVTIDVADTFQGTFFPSFGPGIDVSVQSVEVTETYKAHVTLQVTVHADAATGARSLLLGETHPVGPTFGGCISCLTVT
jgi:hypothetical protein